MRRDLRRFVGYWALGRLSPLEARHIGSVGLL
jgi:hypothetical protein